MEFFKKIFDLPFMQPLADAGGSVFIVGGCVRDHILGKEPKDIDMVVCDLPFESLKSVLEQYGRCDLVGESFGVIKFTHDNITYDVALPRVDKKIDGEKGHKSIEAQSDHTLSIEADLYRRDFTCNALCIGRNLVLIDPYGGMEDIQDGKIACVAPEAFIDDPLRMLRAIQFAPRFEFDLDSQTMKLIKDNKQLIKEIAPERVLDELNKPFEKHGNIPYFGFLLKETGLFFEIFGRELNLNRLDCSTRLSELLHFAIADGEIKTAEFYKKYHPNMNKDLFNELHSFDIVYGPMKQNIYRTMFEAMKKTNFILMSGHIQEKFREPFLMGELPQNRSEVALTGDDLLAMGFKEGKETGTQLEEIITAIFNRTVKNEKAALKELVRNSVVLS